MNTPCKSLILIPIFCFALGGTQSVEAKTCFIVGQCGGDLEANLANTQNCQELGYTKTSCPAGQTLGGARCGEYWEKCVCDTAEYPWLDSAIVYPYTKTLAPGNTNPSCTDDDGVHYKYKVCQSKFQYTSDIYTVPRYKIYYDATSIMLGCTMDGKYICSGDGIEECKELASQTGDDDLWRFTERFCNRDYYKYDQEEVDAKEEELGASGIFNIGEDCGDSKGDYLSSISCSGSATRPRGETHVDGVWTSNCSDDSKDSDSRYDATVGDVTCHWCYTKTCNDITGGMSLDDCKKGLIYGVNHCVPHETIADCYILKNEMGTCPINLASCPQGYYNSEGDCKTGIGEGLKCVEETISSNSCYKRMSKTCSDYSTSSHTYYDSMGYCAQDLNNKPNNGAGYKCTDVSGTSAVGGLSGCTEMVAKICTDYKYEWDWTNHKTRDYYPLNGGPSNCNYLGYYYELVTDNKPSGDGSVQCRTCKIKSCTTTNSNYHNPNGAGDELGTNGGCGMYSSSNLTYIGYRYCCVPSSSSGGACISISFLNGVPSACGANSNFSYTVQCDGGTKYGSDVTCNDNNANVVINAYGCSSYRVEVSKNGYSYTTQYGGGSVNINGCGTYTVRFQ